jgi:hypothetical protein
MLGGRVPRDARSAQMRLQGCLIHADLHVIRATAAGRLSCWSKEFCH